MCIKRIMLVSAAVAAVSFGFCANQAKAAIINVGVGGDIAAAIAKAQEGDIVCLAPGEHVVSATVTLNKAITVTGGFSGLTTIRPSSASFRLFNISHAAAVLCDVTLMGGKGDVSGGAKITAGTLRDSVVTGCSSTGTTVTGGGVYVEGPNAKLIRCVVRDNTGGGYGGGILVIGASKIESCLVTGNKSSWGGGFYIQSNSKAVIANCLVRDNTATAGGSGKDVYNYSSSGVQFLNCGIKTAIAGNQGEKKGCVIGGELNRAALEGKGVTIEGQDWLENKDIDGAPFAETPSVGCTEWASGNRLRVTAVGVPVAGAGELTPGYGTKSGFADGASFPCSAPAAWTNAEETLVAICGGYQLFANGAQIAEGSENEFNYEHPAGELSSTLVWKWVRRVKVGAQAGRGGTVEPTEQWVTEGEQATVTATADETHDFLKWTGVPEAVASENPLQITVTDLMEVQAAFIVKGGVERVWKGGEGFWDEATNWNPAGVPTAQDNAIVSSGAVWAKSSLEVGNLDIGAGAALFFASTGTVSKALATWPEEPKSRSFMVAGDLTCAGTLVVGGLWTVAEKDLITKLQVSVGGNLTLTGAARAGFYAATTPSEFSWDNLYAARTTVAVGGTLSVGDTAILYSTCDELTGAPLCFTCESFNLAVGAKVNAQDRGWAWFKYANTADRDPRKTGDSNSYFTLARHQIADSWGSHACYGAESKAYGYAYAPFMPGSPTCTYQTPQPGGGQFWLVARGTATVEGQVLVDATKSIYGPASGGGIWLCAKKLVADGSALLSAHGGQNSHGSATGGGTGGRISLGLGLSATEIENLGAGATPAELGLNWQDSISEIPVDCSGNRGGAKDKDGNYYYSQPGTVTAVYGSEADTTVTVFGNHAELGEPVPNYGASAFEKGSTQTFTCPAVGYASASERYSCVGYVVSNTTTEVAHGDTTSFSVEIGDEPLSVTWIWGVREIACAVIGVDGATVSVNGVSGGAEGVTKWLAVGEVPVVSVAPDAGCEFLCWEGPIPYGQATANPLTLSADVIRSVRPVVRPVAEPTTRTYNQTDSKTVKVWTDPTAWTPQGIPGAGDDIVIAGKGTLLASNYFACASLTLKDSAIFKIADSASSLLEEAALVVSGDLTMTNTAALTVAPRNQYRRGNLTVGGDLTLFGGTLTVSAGPTNGVDFTYATGAGFVTIDGSLTVLGSSTVVPNSDPWTGGSVVFTVGGDFTLATNAAFKANDNGFERIAGKSPITWGPGWGYDYSIGAGYGGYGSGNNATYGNPYGFALAPIYPGSPSGEYGGGHTGGGLIRIHATGNVFLDGLLDASATAKSTDASSASGGGVWVTAGGRMTVSPGARLLARGGYRCTGAGKPGGGGRIALAQMVTQAQIAAMAADGAYHGPGKEKRHVFDDEAYLADRPDVTIDVNGGEAYAVGKGTFRFIDGRSDGLVILIW